MQGKKQRKRYRRLDRAERAAIQSGLDKGRSCRQMARDLGRSPSTVADEVARNRTVAKGPGKGERVRGVPDDACPRLLSWPRCCNGCRHLRYRSCSRRWRCEYSAARAQALADAELRESRIGVDRDEAGFEYAMGLIRCDVARGLSPQQIALARAGQIGASPSTIYRCGLATSFWTILGRTKPAFLNSTGVMYPSVECILKLLYQCT